MKKNIFIQSVFLVALIVFSCKEELQVGNPNAPTLTGNVTNEAGIISLAQGSVYINGFVNGDGAATQWLGDTYFSLNYGYSELLGDNLGADAANQLISVMNVPDLITLDDGSTIPSTSRAIPLLRTYNTRASTGAGYNPTYYQWLNAYSLNNACNVLLSQLPRVTFTTGDAVSKANTIRAWAYWWKGWAYAAIGSQYYSGLILDAQVAGAPTTPINSNYVLHDAIIDQSNKYYTKADSVLAAIPSATDYTEVITGLIPSFFQTGHGKPPSIAEWQSNIKTMLARNILVNKLAPFVNGNPNATITKSSTTSMTAADWNNVLTLATNGIKNGDNVFAGHSTSTNPVFTTTKGTVSAMTAGTNASTTFKVGERLIQNFKAGDQRLANFTQFYNGGAAPSTVYTNSIFGTRWSLYKSDVNPIPAGVYAYASWADGAYELYMGSSYEENALMLAEANIRLGNIDAGLAYVDVVRTYQGAGVPAVSGTGLNLAQAMTELTRERRVALLFRGLAFYDARRWGWIYDVSNGGGSYGNTFLQNDGSTSGKLNHNVTINYNFLDYWDVPADEALLNPGKGAATINPNFN